MESNDIIDNQGPANSDSTGFNTQTLVSLEKLANWLKLVAIVTLVGDAITFIQLIVTKNFGQIISIGVGVALAVLMLISANALKEYTSSESAFQFDKFARNIRAYFMTLGIISIIALCFVVIVMLIVIVMIAAR